jgi:hypothetical protein
MGPLQWVLYPLLAALLISAPMDITWLTASILAMFLLLLIVFIAAYIYALCTDPEMLRSEKYLATKLAIQHGLGDSLHGEITSKADLVLGETQSRTMVAPADADEDHE